MRSARDPRKKAVLYVHFEIFRCCKSVGKKVNVITDCYYLISNDRIRI